MRIYDMIDKDVLKAVTEGYERARRTLRESPDMQRRAYQIVKGLIEPKGRGTSDLQRSGRENDPRSRVYSREMSKIVTGDVKPDGTQG